MSRWIKFALSVLVTCGSMWWTFKDINKCIEGESGPTCTTHYDQMVVSLKAANWFALIPYVALLLCIHLARTLRWGNLLAGIERIPFKKLNEASAIGFMMLIILPFRLGEFARPFLIAQRSSVRRSAAMTSVVLERIVDGVTIAILLLVLVLFLPDDTPGLAGVRIAGALMFAIFFGGFLFLVLAKWQHERVMRLMRAIFSKISASFAEKIVRIVDGFVGALGQLPGPRDTALFFGFTALYWAMNGYGMSMLANAFDCSGAAGAACTPLHLGVYEGFVVLSVLIVGLMIPAAPGSAGTFQGAVKVALALFLPAAVVNSSGVAYANVLWLVQILQQIVLGMVFLVLSKGSFGDIAGNLSASNKNEEPERVAPAP